LTRGKTCNFVNFVGHDERKPPNARLLKDSQPHAHRRLISRPACGLSSRARTPAVARRGNSHKPVVMLPCFLGTQSRHSSVYFFPLILYILFWVSGAGGRRVCGGYRPAGSACASRALPNRANYRRDFSCHLLTASHRGRHVVHELNKNFF